MIFLHDSTLFVIDIHQNMPISLILTPFDHFQICPTFAVNPNLILEPCHMQLCIPGWIQASIGDPVELWFDYPLGLPAISLSCLLVKKQTGVFFVSKLIIPWMLCVLPCLAAHLAARRQVSTTTRLINSTYFTTSSDQLTLLHLISSPRLSFVF